MGNLIFVTEFYPYGVKEAFIENEIDILAKNFTKVFIITTTPTDTPVRTIPANVILIKLKRPSSWVEILPAIINIRFWKELIITSINVRKIWFCLNFLAKSITIKKTIKKTLNKHKIHNNDTALYSYWFSEGACAISMIEKKGRKISRAHRFDLYKYGNPFFYQPFQKQTLKKLDYVLPCSKHGTKYLQKQFYSLKNKIKTSYLGTYQPNRSKTIQNTKFTLVSCSAITKTKRVALIIDGISKLEEKYNFSIKWIHLGWGPKGDEVKELAKQKLKKTNYTFLGQMKNVDVLHFYESNNIDALINLSSSEGLPVSMMEALSFGIPIIATNVGGVSEIINDKTGILIKDNPSNEEISNAIYKFHSMPLEKMDSLRLSCIKHWQNKFNADSNYIKFIENYLY